ncbi:Barrel-sandwich domain of CusB or HlyD membrane-fusion [Hymenobacter gelipurpurascens]|uniref:Barrel-sandwich domain of CusB or HlyD membrane-fusion n=1 Tax=Hymenobacter gelipurpurascens TaxID=89968 RepID=A0A212T597_9BACT|nr:efflux RND transporter periplasmic adaptor subunit [Hymenobacter gelipurpurascens]SNC61006.1 Barrel-sandwich domain of CusB or HlyD membrane-fusion [Hymenobacter gelipurpurascens]
MGQHSTLPLAAFLLLLPFPEVAQQKATPIAPAQPANTPAAPEAVVLAGIVEPAAMLPVKVSDHGWVRQVFFAEGEYVKKRQILLRLYQKGQNSSEFDRHFLLAPQAGILVKKQVEVGQHVPTGGTVAMLQDVAQVKVPLLMPSPLEQRLKLCDPVSVSILELPSRTFTGLVETIAHTRKPASKQTVTVLIHNTGSPRIRPGMHATVRLPIRPVPAMARR